MKSISFVVIFGLCLQQISAYPFPYPQQQISGENHQYLPLIDVKTGKVQTTFRLTNNPDKELQSEGFVPQTGNRFEEITNLAPPASFQPQQFQQGPPQQQPQQFQQGPPQQPQQFQQGPPQAQQFQQGLLEQPQQFQQGLLEQPQQFQQGLLEQPQQFQQGLPQQPQQFQQGLLEQPQQLQQGLPQQPQTPETDSYANFLPSLSSSVGGVVAGSLSNPHEYGETVPGEFSNLQSYAAYHPSGQFSN